MTNGPSQKYPWPWSPEEMHWDTEVAMGVPFCCNGSLLLLFLRGDKVASGLCHLTATSQ